MKKEITEIKTLQSLEYHRRVMNAILDRFINNKSVSGVFVSGSVARDSMDEFSDIDIGICYKNEKERLKDWEVRCDWNILPWFHRFDADHIKPFFVIYFFEPWVKADINLYTKKDLPPPEGGIYKIIRDDEGDLKVWIENQKTWSPPKPDWSQAAHEDERFWAWNLYLSAHIKRGELYGAAREFPQIAGIMETWIARLNGNARFEARHKETEYSKEERLGAYLFPEPTHSSLKKSVTTFVREFTELRKVVQDKIKPNWKVTERTIEKVTALIEGI